jgi:hypothetical protein
MSHNFSFRRHGEEKPETNSVPTSQFTGFGEQFGQLQSAGVVTVSNLGPNDFGDVKGQSSSVGNAEAVDPPPKTK